MPDDAPLAWDAQDEDDLFLMANLFPRDTGLPMTIWVSERGGARHDVRLKVGTIHGARPVRRDEQAVVGVRPTPRLIHGELSRDDLDAVSAWITLNVDIIMEYWSGEASTIDLARRIRRLPA